MDRLIGIRNGAYSVKPRLAGRRSMRLKEAFIIPQVIGLSRSIKLSTCPAAIPPVSKK